LIKDLRCSKYCYYDIQEMDMDEFIEAEEEVSNVAPPSVMDRWCHLVDIYSSVA
jgi:hypothetical protein